MRKVPASLGLLGATLPLAADGAVIYSGWLDVDVPSGPAFTLPLVADGFDGGAVEFEVFSTNRFPSGGPRANLIQRVADVNSGLRLIGSGAFDVYFFQTLDLVRPNTSNTTRFGNAVSDFRYWPLNFVGEEFAALGRPIIGFRTSEFQHGWVRSELFLEEGGSTFRILDWAVETEPGKPIEIFPVPEPSPTGLAALALGAAAVFRRRRQGTRRALDSEPTDL